MTASSTVGRIAWFKNPGTVGGTWKRHDISRRVRGMYDQFNARDMDGDGDIDLVGTRGNSGRFDGVFWLEQVQSKTAHRSFTPAALSKLLASWASCMEQQDKLRHLPFQVLRSRTICAFS